MTLLCSVSFGATLTVTASSTGGSVSPTTKSVSAGTKVSISASPITDYRFSSWGFVSGKENCVIENTKSEKTSVTVNGDCTIKASFVHVFLLEVVTTGDSKCGSAFIGTGTTSTGVTSKPVQYAGVSSVSAIVNAGCHLREWGVVSGADNCSITNTSETSVRVTVRGACRVKAQIARIYEATISAESGGTVSPSKITGDAWDVPQKVKAVPNAGYRFDKWTSSSDYCIVKNETSAETEVGAYANCTVKASFVKTQTLTMSATSGGNVTPSGSNAVDKGASVAIKGVPWSGHRFSKWTTSDATKCPIDNENSASTSVKVNDDCTVKAEYVRTYTLFLSGSNGTFNFSSKIVEAGSKVDISTSAQAGYRFDKWMTSDATNCPIANETSVNTSVTVKGSCTVKANFVKAFYVSVNQPEKSINETVGGGDYLPIEYVPNEAYEFSGWSYCAGTNASAETSAQNCKIEDPLATKTRVLVNGFCDICASRVKVYDVSITTKGGGTVSHTKERVPVTTPLKVMASPNSGYRFDQWKFGSNCNVSSSTSATTTVVPVDGNCSVEAVFVRQYTLTVTNKNPTFGSVSPATTVTVDAGSTQKIVATANKGFGFYNWVTYGSSCSVDNEKSSTTTVTVNGNCEVFVNFVPLVKVTTSAGEGGSVSPAGTAEMFGGTFATSAYKIVATPKTGYRFDKWTSNSEYCYVEGTTSSTLNLIPKGDCEIKAHFVRQFTLSVSKGVNGTVFPVGSFALDSAATKSVSATPNAGYVFTSWLSTNSGCSFSNDSAKTAVVTVLRNCTVSAKFVPIRSITVEHVGFAGDSVYSEKYSVAEGFTQSVKYVSDVYKVNSLEVISGNCSVKSKTAYLAEFVGGSENCSVRANYVLPEPREIVLGANEITPEDFYQKKTRSTRFWFKTEPDVWYSISIKNENGRYSLKDFGNDSSFTVLETSFTYYGELYVKGDGKNHYFSYDLVSTYNVVLTKIQSETLLTVESSAGGSVDPSGENVVPKDVYYPIVAQPDAYHRFEKWNVLSGTCAVEYAVRAITRVKTNGKPCVVQAEFVPIDTIAPQMDVVKLDDSKLPNEICVDVALKQSNGGFVRDYKDVSFVVRVDDNEIPVKSLSEGEEIEDGVSIALVVDGSTSLRPYEDKVRRFIVDFIENLKDGYRMSLVMFGRGTDYATTLQPLTSDKSALLAAANNYVIAGGNAPESGVSHALEELQNAPGKRFVFLVSDGYTDVQMYSEKDVVNRALALNVEIHAAHYSFDDYVHNMSDVQYMSERTGGTYSVVKNLSDFIDIYNDLDLNEPAHAQRLCYEPLDKILNGENHEIKIESELAEFTSEYVYSWTEPAWRDTNVNDSIYVTEAIRTTSQLEVKVVTQNFANDAVEPIDFVNVMVMCAASGDEEKVTLNYVDAGLYVNYNLPKNEVAGKNSVKGDGVLSCASKDSIIVLYVDPVYGDTTRYVEAFEDSVESSSQFVDGSGKDAVMDSIESFGSEFKFHINAFSESLYEVDTLQVLLFNDQGDSVWTKAVETGDYTSLFNGEGSFEFVMDASDVKQNDRIEILADGDSSVVRSVIYIQLYEDGKPSKILDSLVVYYDLLNSVPADYAELLDKDLDGRADFVRVRFAKPISNEVLSIDIAKDIEVSADGLWIEAALDEPFEYGVTDLKSAPVSQIKISKMGSKFPQKISLKDRVGAVPVSAVKHPGKLSDEDYMDGKVELPPDTLVVTMSEAVDSIAAKTFELVAGSAAGSAAKSGFVKYGKASADKSRKVWTLVLARSVDIHVGDTLRTNPDASTFDKAGNAPGIGGVTVTGEEGEVYLYAVKAHPPVVKAGNRARIKVETKKSYKAYVTIFDNMGNFIAQFNGRSKFEDVNADNATQVSFIEWDQYTDDGRLAGTGVYIWKIHFVFSDGHKEWRTIRTGIKR